MKSLLLFYLAILLPLLALVLLSRMHLVGPLFFTISILLYALVYHPFISGLRLIATGKIRKNQFMLNFIPSWNWRFFEFLFFNSRL